VSSSSKNYRQRSYNDYYKWTLILTLKKAALISMASCIQLDISLQHWTTPNVSGEKPPPRYSHTTCYIGGPLTGQQHPMLMVVGGHGKQAALGDLWLLYVDKLLWSELIASSNPGMLV